ncbi:MAG: serine hydrolase [Bacteroidetes bacterium]|nr:serine hydrolase [Bacteroidota bacterium]MBS1608854.1 serine hydrolase [Bacteroidota bacterium]
MKKSFSCLLLFCLLCVTVNAQHHNTSNVKAHLTEAIDSILNGAVDREEIPGAVIGIEQDGKIIYKQAYGFSQKYDFGHKLLAHPPMMNTETMFDMASLTKVIGTTTAIMLLVDRGLIHPDDPVGKYIKGFDTLPKSTITIRHLLTHTAGLYEWYPLFYRSAKRQTTYDLIHSLPLKYPVGKQRSYSDLGFVLLGEIIEKVSGLSLNRFEDENIFNPLGMTHTLYNPLEQGRVDNIAATSLGNPYEKRMVYDSSLGFSLKEIDPASWNGWRDYVLKGEVNDGNTWYANEGISGAAGLFSTVDDLQKLANMLMDKGHIRGQKFISESTIDSFLKEDRFHNGLGWMMDSTNSFMKEGPTGTFGHTGFTGTSIVIVPQYHLSVILLINRQNMGLLPSGQYYNPNMLRQKIFRAVMNYAKGKK